MRLRLEHVTARHPLARAQAAAALHELSLEVAAGECVAVIGPSGAGKTTLLQVMACAMPAAQGHFLLDEVQPWSLPRAQLQRLRGRLFLAPQVPPLPPRQRVVTAVLAGRLPAMSLWASLRSLFYPADIPAADDALALAGEDLADQSAGAVGHVDRGELAHRGEPARQHVVAVQDRTGVVGDRLLSNRTTKVIRRVDHPKGAP